MRQVRTAWRRYRASPARNVVSALVITAVLVWGSYGEGHPQSPSDTIQFRTHHPPQPSLAALLLVAVACLALAWRQRRPEVVLAVSTAAVLGYTLAGYVNGAALLAPVLALCTLATQVSPRRAAVAATVTAAVLLAATSWRNPFGDPVGGGIVLIPFLAAAALFAGIAVGNRRAYVLSLQERAHEEARRRVGEERLRIARELHDVVAHTMATINVQAGTAAHVAGSRPEVATEALLAIKAASKDGLRELRAILDVLRQADDAEPTQPAPGLAALEALAGRASASGLPVTVAVTGEPVPLPAAGDLAAYRIIQESLTNAIRHAGPATATVALDYGRGGLRIEVTDTGLGPGAGTGSSPGHGLAGMRERAAAAGGSVEAGPAPGGGFRVSAWLPLPARPAPPAPVPNHSAPAPPAPVPAAPLAATEAVAAPDGEGGPS
jgi:signal transduction histidine kinase